MRGCAREPHEGVCVLEGDREPHEGVCMLEGERETHEGVCMLEGGINLIQSFAPSS